MIRKTTLQKMQRAFLFFAFLTPVFLIGAPGNQGQIVTTPPNCNLHVDAGNDVDVCEPETVTLTASVDGASECVGGCEYPIIEEARCHEPNNISDVWLMNPYSNEFNTITSKFETLNDGTARYTASASNGVDRVEVDILFSGYTTTAPQGSPKENVCDTYDTTDWVYWTTTTGTITSELHGVFEVTRKGPSMQMGNGADVTRNGFGASGWLTITGGDGFYQDGDINIKLGTCTPINVDSEVQYLWTTTDGVIIGDANQQTITVGASGTYTVSVTDCELCIASDEVVVSINELPVVDAGDDVQGCSTEPVILKASAKNSVACEGACEYPIEEMAKCDVPAGNTEELHIINAYDSRFYTTASSFIAYGDGTAQYTATASNGLDTIEANIIFSGYTTVAPQDSPMLNDCDVYDTSAYVYWTDTKGTITSELHGVFNISRKGPAFQMGNGADVRRAGFGASGWFMLSGGDGHYYNGDLNLKLGECVPVATTNQVNYTWTTEDGNILGDANQQTIAVDASGTYKVTVSNCSSCTAMDEVVVSMINADAGTITPDAETVCLTDEDVRISATPDDNQVVPVNYVQAYVLTAGDDFVLRQLAASPEFTVFEPGKFAIHTIVYPANVDLLNMITFRETTAADVVNSLSDTCASLDGIGAATMVEYLGCSKAAPNSVAKIFPMPATTGSKISLVINTETGKVATGSTSSTSKGNVLPLEQESITISLYHMNSGRLVSTSKPYTITKGKDTIDYTIGQAASGLYLLKVNGTYWSDTKQIVIK